MAKTSNVLPSSTPIDVANYALRNCKSTGKLTLRNTLLKQRQNRSDFKISKLRIAVSFPNGHAAFLHRVAKIVFGGAKKQMIGIAARTKIAFVTYMQSIRNWTENQFVSDPMGCDKSPVIESEHSVTIILNHFPRPTVRFGTDFNFGPKAVFDRKILRARPAPFSTEFTGANVGFLSSFWHDPIIGILWRM